MLNKCLSFFSKPGQKLAMLLGVVLCLSACAERPTLILSPSPDTPHVSLGSHELFSLTVEDLRTHQYVVAIHKEDEATRLIHANIPITKAVDLPLQNGWRNMGITLSRHGTNKVKVLVLEAQTDVEQSLLNYQSTTEIAIEVKIDVGTRQMSKVFSGKASEKAPLEPDVTKLESNFNRLLSKVLGEILSDPLVQEYLHKAA